tara:strand:+ start:2758 stop:3405 length:648 start_codon:yes stop_codon:yes gene_type:complete
MDGNGRWAKHQGKSRQYGHEIGSSKVYNIFNSCIDLGFNTATFFAMSSENMKRSNSETDFIASLLDISIKKHFSDLIANKIKFKVIGDISSLPENIKTTIREAEDATKKYTDYNMNIAYNYGGQWDIANSVNKALSNNQSITPSIISKHLSTGDNCPDLIIRTGGFKRLSNFMLWQSAYSELFFIDTLWPDMNKTQLTSIFKEYVSIKRNFGVIE